MQLRRHSKSLRSLLMVAICFYSIFFPHAHFSKTKYVLRLQTFENYLTNMSQEFTQGWLVSQASPSCSMLTCYHTKTIETALHGICMPCSIQFLAECAWIQRLWLSVNQALRTRQGRCFDLLTSFLSVSPWRSCHTLSIPPGGSLLDCYFASGTFSGHAWSFKQTNVTHSRATISPSLASPSPLAQFLLLFVSFLFVLIWSISCLQKNSPHILYFQLEEVISSAVANIRFPANKEKH